ncbi:hypothetical protein [Streptomyces sp. NBC_01429]|uniref:hypothetical protein n=1 Tax=Streptomyces sp. NBC_01429 TaxID=2903862 RepID=UPI002E2CB49B|nr:hypothetical protein [Streptomyces sp. NBC_01429]
MTTTIKAINARVQAIYRLRIAHVEECEPCKLDKPCADGTELLRRWREGVRESRAERERLR